MWGHPPGRRHIWLGRPWRTRKPSWRTNATFEARNEWTGSAQKNKVSEHSEKRREENSSCLSTTGKAKHRERAPSCSSSTVRVSSHFDKCVNAWMETSDKWYFYFRSRRRKRLSRGVDQCCRPPPLSRFKNVISLMYVDFVAISTLATRLRRESE